LAFSVPMKLSAGCATLFLLAAAPTDTQSLCETWRNTKKPAVFAEIERRKEFTARDLDLIERRKIKVGMTEKAMRCSWEPPQRSHRTTTSAGTTTQHVYRDTIYIYVEKGIVVSWQD
jgi:hypothetical protein